MGSSGKDHSPNLQQPATRSLLMDLESLQKRSSFGPQDGTTNHLVPAFITHSALPMEQIAAALPLLARITREPRMGAVVFPRLLSQLWNGEKPSLLKHHLFHGMLRMLRSTGLQITIRLTSSILRRSEDPTFQPMLLVGRCRQILEIFQ